MKEVKAALWDGLKPLTPTGVRDEIIDKMLSSLNQAGYHIVSTPEQIQTTDPDTDAVTVSLKMTLDGRPLVADYIVQDEDKGSQQEEVTRQEATLSLGRNLLIELGLWNREADLPVAWVIPKFPSEEWPDGSGPYGF